MHYQLLQLDAPVSSTVLDTALATIDNIEDLCDTPIRLATEYDGFIQVVVLMHLAYKRRLGGPHVTA